MIDEQLLSASQPILSFASRLPGEGVDELTLRRLLGLLSPERQEVLKRLRNQEAVQRSLMAEILLRWALCEQDGMRNEEIRVTHDPNGKPVLAGRPNRKFNLSHSGEWVACALHHRELGVDIEQIRTIHPNISRDFFAEAERRAIDAAPSKADRQRLFFRIWTLKESYLKATGRGLRTALNSFSVDCRDASRITITPTDGAPCFFKQYEVDPRYEVSLCGFEPNFAPHMRLVTWETLCRFGGPDTR